MKFLLLLSLLPLQLIGQDFTGLWTGFLSLKEGQLPYELAISGEKDNLNGYSLTIFIIGDIENTGIKSLKIKNKKTSIALEDDELIYSDYKIASKKVTLYAKLAFEGGSTTVLQGTFFTRSVDRSSYNGTIRLKKKDDFAKTKLISQLEKMNLLNKLSFRKPKSNEQEDGTIAANELAKKSPPVIQPGVGTEIKTEPLAKDQPVSQPDLRAETKNASIAKNQPVLQPGVGEEIKTVPIAKDRPVPASLPVQKKPVLVTSSSPLQIEKKIIKPLKEAAADLASRQTEIIRSVNFQSDSLVLSLYDNGEVDGDTVSVLVNDKIVIARKGLSTNAIKTTVYTPAGSADSLQVIMYAENLGRIAPNTGLLIVEDGAERYQIRFEGDFKKNSAIIFRRKR